MRPLLFTMLRYAVRARARLPFYAFREPARALLLRRVECSVRGSKEYCSGAQGGVRNEDGEKMAVVAARAGRQADECAVNGANRRHASTVRA